MAKTETDKEEIHVPGTLVLVFIFLGWFAFFYFLSWWFLSGLWSIR